MKATSQPSRKLTVALGKADAKGVDTEVVAVFQDSGKKAIPPKRPYSEAVDRLRRDEVFNARTGSVQFLRFAGKGAENALLVGLGPVADLTEEKARQAGG